MNRWICRCFLCSMVLLGIGSVTWGAPAAKSDKAAAKVEKLPAKAEKSAAKSEKAAVKNEDSAAAPATYTVKKGPFKITVDLDGIFEANTAREIFVKLDEWNTLSVESAVAHGARVHRGEVLLSLETEKIDHAIADLRAELKLAQVAAQQNEDQLRVLEKTTPLDLESSRRASRLAEEDQKYFFDIDEPFVRKATDFSLKAAREALEYQQEELRQLEKMYKADDITEETEKIVLKRARDAVEKAQFSVEYATLSHDHVFKYAIPRVEDMIKESARRKSLEWEKDRVQLPLALQKQRLELDKLRLQQQRADDKLTKLLADREAMTVKSPIDGVVYYGKCVRGKFSDSTNMADNLRRNGSIMPNQVVMTVVEPRPIFIRATVPEDQLHRVRPNLKGIATPAGDPELKLAATVDNVSDVPTAPGSFDAHLSVALDHQAPWLMPGMTCTVKLVPYLKKDAIAVPAKAVATDELDEQKHFVQVLGKDGKPQKRAVTIGEKADRQTEILKGLNEGEKVLLEKPSDQK